MKKRGFTLVELLISIAIIGVVAALCAPTLSNLMTNKKKALYIKTYKNLAEISAEVANDPGNYWTIYDSDNKIKYEGTANFEQPYNEDDKTIETSDGPKDIQNELKFPALIVKRMNIAGQYNIQNKSHGDNFRTIDGIEWTYDYTGSRDDASNFKHIFTINMAPDSDDNQCTYSSTCTNPNEFKFEIDNDGNVKAADAMGMVYLQNSDKLNGFDDDKELAASVISKAGSDSDIDKMAKALNQLKVSTTTTK